VQQLIENGGGRLLAVPAYWASASAGTLYLWCEADFLKAYRFDEPPQCRARRQGQLARADHPVER